MPAVRWGDPRRDCMAKALRVLRAAERPPWAGFERWACVPEQGSLTRSVCGPRMERVATTPKEAKALLRETRREQRRWRERVEALRCLEDHTR
jgi:hypothetical protein